MKTFVINEIVDLNEDNTFSLVNSDLENRGTVVIKDGKITLYYEDGKPEEKFGDDYDSLIKFVKDSDLNFIKLRNGARRWKLFNPNPKYSSLALTNCFPSFVVILIRSDILTTPNFIIFLLSILK